MMTLPLPTGTVASGGTRYRPHFVRRIENAAGEVVERWTGAQVDTKLARGYQGAVAGKVNRWWIWLPLCVLFLAPFVDVFYGPAGRPPP